MKHGRNVMLELDETRVWRNMQVGKVFGCRQMHVKGEASEATHVRRPPVSNEAKLVILLDSEEAHLCHSRLPVLKRKHVEGEHLADKTQVFLPTGGMVWLGGEDMAGLRRVKESIRGGVELCKGGRQEVEKIKPWGALGEREAFGDEGGKVAIRKRWQRKMGRGRGR